MNTVFPFLNSQVSKCSSKKNMGSASVHIRRPSVVSDAYESVCKAVANKDVKDFRIAVRESPDEVILELMGKLDDLRSKAEKKQMASITTDSMDLPETLRNFSPLCEDERIVRCRVPADNILSQYQTCRENEDRVDIELNRVVSITRDVIGERLREKHLLQRCRDVVREGNADFVNVYEAVWNTIKNNETEQILNYKRIVNTKLQVFPEKLRQTAKSVTELFHHAVKTKEMYDETMGKLLEGLQFKPWNVSIPKHLKSSGRVAEKTLLRPDQPGCANDIFDMVKESTGGVMMTF